MAKLNRVRWKFQADRAGKKKAELERCHVATAEDRPLLVDYNHEAIHRLIEKGSVNI